MNKIVSMTFLFMVLAVNAWGSGGYIFPDYYRLLVNGMAVTLNLGISREGTLFLKLNESEYPIAEPAAFKRGTQQAMEYTQALQQGGESAANLSASGSDTSPLLLYTSTPSQEKGQARFFILAFDHRSSAGRYPIKISFHDGTHQPQSFDFPPGELQYLQKTIDIALENKADAMAKAQASRDGGQ
jgi:hypothetical protein